MKPSNDLLHRFIFEDADIRGELVTLGDSYRQILTHHNYPPSVQALLGEFLAAIGLLSSTLKFDGIISLQARGDGAVSTIMAECTHHNSIRAIARLNENVPMSESVSQQATLKELLGNAVLFITIEPKRTEIFGGKLERYQGIVPMDAENLAGCLEHYFEQSEQLETRLWFAADSEHASGFLIQALPKQLHKSDDINQDHWDTVIALAETVQIEELLTLDHPTILYRLFNEQNVRVYDPRNLHFACSCSRERSASALISLGKDEVEELLIEKGSIDIDCQFCNQHYHFSAAEVRELLGGSVLH